MSKKFLLGVTVSLLASPVFAVTVYTAPVMINPPLEGVTRTVWCVAQNLTPNEKEVVSSVIFGEDSKEIQNKTAMVAPGGTAFLAGAQSGSGLVYCKFNVSNKQKVRTYLTVLDNPDGREEYTASVLVVEAK